MTAEGLGVCIGPSLFQSDAAFALESNPAVLAIKSMALATVVADMCKSTTHFTAPYERLGTQYTQATGIAPAPLTEAEWAKVLDNAQLVKCDRNDVLFQEGKPIRCGVTTLLFCLCSCCCSRLFRVRNGTFDVLLGDKVIMHDLGATSLFGELSLLDRDATAYGTVRCTSANAEVEHRSYGRNLCANN